MPGIDQGSLPQFLFDRLDNAPDAEFYRSPRLVAHVDEATLAALRAYYEEILFDGANVLDLISSWISHLPAHVELGEVAGLGMNTEELDVNERLTVRRVHDLNIDPTLPYAAAAFDFVFIAFSIQYLIRPLEVFAEIARVLRTGGKLVVACSHRCFPTKAIRAFHVAEPQERLRLIAEYVRRTPAFHHAEICERSPERADPLWLVCAERR
jgi:SAM-dependent methyltransferase